MFAKKIGVLGQNTISRSIQVEFQKFLSPVVRNMYVSKCMAKTQKIGLKTYQNAHGRIDPPPQD